MRNTNEKQNENVKVVEVEKQQPVEGLQTTTTETTSKNEVLEQHTILEISDELCNKVREYYNAHHTENGTLRALAKIVGVPYYTKHPITGRSTGHAEINGEYYDLWAFLSLFNVQRIDHGETDPATGEKKKRGRKAATSPQSKSDKIRCCYTTFLNRLKELVVDEELLKEAADLEKGIERVATAIETTEKEIETAKNGAAALFGGLDGETLKAFNGLSPEQVKKLADAMKETISTL